MKIVSIYAKGVVRYCKVLSALMLVLAVASFSLSYKEKAVMSSVDIKPAPTLIIDAGHGGLTNTID